MTVATGPNNDFNPPMRHLIAITLSLGLSCLAVPAVQADESVSIQIAVNLLSDNLTSETSNCTVDIESDRLDCEAEIITESEENGQQVFRVIPI